MRPDNDVGDMFMVPFQGELVRCFSLDDAVAIKNASIALDDRDWRQFRPAQLDGLVAVLTKYDQLDAAESLTQLTSRLRAAPVLTAPGDARPRRQ